MMHTASHSGPFRQHSPCIEIVPLGSVHRLLRCGCYSIIPPYSNSYFAFCIGPSFSHLGIFFFLSLLHHAPNIWNWPTDASFPSSMPFFLLLLVVPLAKGQLMWR
ncbi:hypothetical protein V8C37DRAFT_384561 [Trichoderma ceciliae]